MEELLKTLTKKLSLVLILAAVIFLLLSAASGFTLNNVFSLQISDPNWRIALGIIGLGMLIFGLYWEWRERFFSKLPAEDSLTAERQDLTEKDNPANLLPIYKKPPKRN